MLGLFHGRPGARAWRRILTVEGVKSALQAVLTAEAERRERALREPLGAP